MINYVDNQYLILAEKILKEGDERPTRNGIRKTIFGPQMVFNLEHGFPIITSKKIFTKGIIHELIWFLSGDTNTKYLTDNGVHIWDANADENGVLGPVYGHQWRHWGNDEVDQIRDLMFGLKNDPFGTRHIVTAWNPSDLADMALPPCHCFMQFDVTTDGKLNLQMYQRSADWFLGVPFNISSYALLLEMVAKTLDLKPGLFIHTFGNAHIYECHYEQMKEQIQRTSFPLPKLEFERKDSILDYEFDDFKIVGYQSHPTLKGEMVL